MRHIYKCSVCGFENPQIEGLYICEQCGSFLTDRSVTRKLVELNNKKYKDDPSVPLVASSNPFVRRKPSISTGSFLFDRILQTGGIPVGSRLELYGPEKTGKSTIALQLIAAMQKKNATCLYVDLEHSLCTDYAKTLGVDLENLYISNPNSGTQAIEIIGSNCEAFDLIVLDSVAMLTKQSFIDKQQKVDASGSIEEAMDFAGPASLVGQLQNKYGPRIGKSGCTLILLNQARENIVPGKGALGMRSPGGRTLRHFTTHRVEIKRCSGVGSDIIENGTKIGYKIKAKIVKNKSGIEGGEAELDFLYNKGLSREREYVVLGLDSGFLTRAGSWFRIDGKNIANGMDAMYELLAKDKALKEKLHKHVEEFVRLGAQPTGDLDE